MLTHGCGVYLPQMCAVHRQFLPHSVLLFFGLLVVTTLEKGVKVFGSIIMSAGPGKSFTAAPS